LSLFVFTKLLPGNVLIKSVTVLICYLITSLMCHKVGDFFSLALQPPWALASAFQFHDHFTDGRTPWTSD
jgi:hypothetical protein